MTIMGACKLHLQRTQELFAFCVEMCSRLCYLPLQLLDSGEDALLRCAAELL